jgi:uncharacterized repeat protein (TIGR01451 family)
MVLTGYPGLRPVRLFQRPEAVLEQERLRGQQRSGWQLADLNLYYALPINDAVQAVQLADALNKLDVVEIAYPEPLAEPADVSNRPRLGDVGLPTPSFVGSQGYLSSTVSHNGVDAVYAWTLPGGAGAGIRFIDIEFAWQTTHEDLLGATRFYSAGKPYSSYSDHGTAVVGEVVADNDATGISGIAHDVQYGVQAVGGGGNWPNVASSINAAAAQLDAGDVILIELHNPGPSSGEWCICNCPQFEFVAMEYWLANYDAIQNATANGIIVVEAAGNGGMNFDNPIYGGAFDRSVRDSGAIVVGAGLSGMFSSAAREPHCWTNYGSRVDVHAWGDSIWTLGYGYGWNEGMVGGDPDDQDQWYTSFFGGTSGASPIVVGAVASINGMRKAAGLPVLTPLQMRDLLRNTGTPQARDHKPIGPLPNLKPASDGLFHTVAFTDTRGNRNGAPEPGERGLLLDVGLETLGITTYDGVSATLASTFPGLTILTPTNVYPTLTPTGGVTIRSFAFDLADSIPCGASLPFTLSVVTAQGPYSAAFHLLTGALAANSTTFDSTDVPQPIPDGSWTGVTSTLATSSTTLVGDLDVTLWISHSDVGDLRAYLYGPGDTAAVTLFENVPTSTADFGGTILDDEAVTGIYNAGSPGHTSSYRPDGFLANFDGRAGDGTWRLYVQDIGTGDIGTINGWSLTVTPRVCASRASPTATKTGPDFVELGQLLTYTLIVTNPGDLPLYNIVVTETYDANTSFYGADPLPTSGDDVWSFAQLGPNGVQRITITVQVTSTVADYTVLTNTVQIRADQVSPFTVTETTRALRLPQFDVAKQANPDPPRSWYPFTYTLTVSNSGGTATDVVITDALPTGASYASGGNYAGGIVTWGGLTLPASDTLDVTVVVTACSGTLVNSAYRVATCAQGVSSPWGAPVTTTVRAPNLAADFAPVSVSVPANTTIAFTDASTTDGGPIVAWRWNFGDEWTGSGRVVSHTYTAVGAYTVTLIVTDTCGYTNTKRQPGAVNIRSQVFLPLVLRN